MKLIRAAVVVLALPVGTHVPPLPSGYKETSGVCVRLGNDTAHDCDYSFATLANSASKKQILYAGRSEGHDPSGKPRFRVLDAVDISALPPAYRMTLWECSVNGVVDETIVAAVRNTDEQPWFREILWAKRFDLQKGAFVDISLAGVKCLNVGMG
jgi:hypothetical protein